MNNIKKAGLYIHVPFCSKKCNYCDFYSFKADVGLKERYVRALTGEIRAKASAYADRLFDTVYIGGGTPTELGSSLLCEIIREVYSSFTLTSDCEFTVESNPGLDVNMLALHESGANRLSIGLQSANSCELAVLGRIHTLNDYFETVSQARAAGFDNISTDIMFSLPSQSTELLENTLKTVIETAPEHISAYSLKIEPGTPFYKIKERLALPNEDADADMYAYICKRLDEAGYGHYEISNFAKKGYESRHNLRYWECKEYIGLGPGAHSYIDSVRYSYKRDLLAVCDAYEKGVYDGIIDEHTLIDESEAMRERIMLGLRLGRGIKLSELDSVIPRERLLEVTAPLEKCGYLSLSGNALVLSEKGMYVSNAIISSILSLT
ncbi:MAG: radical SAM family heme chaperone HemW [Clostridia bacterium]|nr:radical SAM family heme chaperone HemW [Clostridia bacterium]